MYGHPWEQAKVSVRTWQVAPDGIDGGVPNTCCTLHNYITQHHWPAAKHINTEYMHWCRPCYYAIIIVPKINGSQNNWVIALYAHSMCEKPLCYRFEVWPFLFSLDGGGNMSEWFSRVIAAWLEWFPEKSSWCRKEQVCQRVNYEVLWADIRTAFCAI